jgi:Putative esterase
VNRIRLAWVSSRLLLLGALLVAPFAFPQAAFASSVSDNFNRANGGLGSNWTTVAGTAVPRIVSNRLTVGTASTPNGAYWSANTFGSNQFAQATLPNSSATRYGPGIAVRLSSSRGYFLWYGNAANTVSLWRMDGPTSWSQLGQSAVLTVTPSADVWRITAVGSTITGYQNGSQVVQATDAGMTSGSPGVWLYYSSNQIGNWSGGDVAPPTTHTIGGTVSGLSGTAVLQNNGGNDLNVSSNGSVTFTTPLTTGSAYGVTVRTNPAGQTCTVANGSGTVGTSNVTNVAVNCSNAATYSIGGTASGLSGAAVVQDNSGDNLSVAANGGFTFATRLTPGSAYNITVLSNPSGQTCTVSSGTGTVATASVTNVGVTCASNPAGAGSSGSYSDDFNRADGPLGPNWTDESDGGLAITSQSAAGTAASSTTGDIRTAESYGSNQYSQIAVASTQLTNGQWIGTAVRMQNGGQNGYVGLYHWNDGNPELLLFKRTDGSWSQLGTAYSCGPLAAGTQLKLMVVGTTLAFMEDGVERIAAYDNTYAGGAPGIVAYGTGRTGTWSGGGAGFEVHYLSTDSGGVESYDVISAKNGDGPQVLRVLRPTNPAPGVTHNFLYALPVEAGLGTYFGDGMATLQGMNAHNQYNLTIIEPSFAIEPWFADNPSDANLQYEAFMATELQPWVKAHLATTGTEQHWLIGFSKSGIGGQDLMLRHPDLFTLAASWDFPADMSSYDEYGSSSAGNYGTDANFQANYRLTQSFVDAHRAPFVASNRMWIGGYEAFQTDMTDYDALLTSEGIRHSTETPTPMGHRWDGGWVPIALAALAQESTNLH